MDLICAMKITTRLLVNIWHAAKYASLTTILLSSAALHAQQKADIILHHGKVATMDRVNQFVEAVAMRDGLVLETGTSAQLLSQYRDTNTRVIDLNGRTVIPGLNDSHIHIIREGLHYNAELRWDGVKTLKRAMEMLKEQAARTPEGVWIKVIGGWNEFQFEEKR